MILKLHMLHQIYLLDLAYSFPVSMHRVDLEIRWTPYSITVD